MFEIDYSKRPLDSSRANMKILIVEDESLIAMQYQVMLQTAGYQDVMICNSGNEAVTLSQTFRPDIIFMDYSLKGAMTGLEAGIAIRNTMQVPIFFITAFADSISPEKKLSLQDVFFLDKPVNKGKLIEMIHSL
jgi:CheY-like chemotaxis protein